MQKISDTGQSRPFTLSYKLFLTLAAYFYNWIFSRLSDYVVTADHVSSESKIHTKNRSIIAGRMWRLTITVQMVSMEWVPLWSHVVGVTSISPKILPVRWNPLLLYFSFSPSFPNYHWSQLEASKKNPLHLYLLLSGFYEGIATDPLEDPPSMIKSWRGFLYFLFFSFLFFTEQYRPNLGYSWDLEGLFLIGFGTTGKHLKVR